MATPASSIHLSPRTNYINCDVSYRRTAIVHKSYECTYFSLITTQGDGHAGGYGGIQELPNGRKCAIFSLWNDDKTGEDVYNVTSPTHPTEPFGGEGTGRKCMIDYNWKIGEKICFMINTKLIGEWYYYSRFIKKFEDEKWLEIATYKRRKIAGHPAVTTGSFIEDWNRCARPNNPGFLYERSASYGELKIIKLENSFHPEIFSVTNYSFSTVTSGADELGSNRVSARKNKNGILLRTGGEVTRGERQQHIAMNMQCMMTDQKCYCCLKSACGLNFCGGDHCPYNQCQKLDDDGARCWNPIRFESFSEESTSGIYCGKCSS